MVKILLWIVAIVIGVPLLVVAILAAGFYALFYEPERANATMISGSQEREYLLHVPKTHDRTKPTALMVSLHGASSWPGMQKRLSGWNAVADEHGFIVVYPSGTSVTGSGSGAGISPKAWLLGKRLFEADRRFIQELIDRHRRRGRAVPRRGGRPLVAWRESADARVVRRPIDAHHRCHSRALALLRGASVAAPIRIIARMEKFTVHTGLVAPLDRENVDTDSIIPKQFLKSIKRTGFGPHLFDAWRYFDVGEPGMDLRNRKPNPDFVLNKPQYQGASILLARKNFGCGSSREHAPWALQQYGFKAVIATSFAEIFYNNCFKNGLLAIVLSETEVERLFHEVAATPGYKLTIDLPAQTVDGMHFDIDPTRKENLINGLDEIGLTLRHADEIKAYEEKRKRAEPWIFK